MSVTTSWCSCWAWGSASSRAWCPPARQRVSIRSRCCGRGRAMLKLNGVWRTYQVGDAEVVALHDVKLPIGDGEFVAIVGPSGSGKSTLLQIVGLLDRPTRGIVTLDDHDLDDLDDAARTRLRL